MKRYAILVVWNDGEEEYVADAAGNPAVFHNKQAAKEQAEFMEMGMEDYQSINVVTAPAKEKGVRR